MSRSRPLRTRNHTRRDVKQEAREQRRLADKAAVADPEAPQRTRNVEVSDRWSWD